MNNSDTSFEFMKVYKFIFISLFVIAVPLFFINDLKVTKINDLTLENNDTIVVGEGEPCEFFYTKIQCAKGLSCVLTSSSEHRNGVCLKEGTNLSEDSILRNPLIQADESDRIFIPVNNINVSELNISN